MRSYFHLKHSFDLIVFIIAILGFCSVIQTFFIGKHYIIPTALLSFSIISGNLTYYGFKENRIAKKILYWLFFTLTTHLFFALFFSVKYRTLLGDYFEPICILNILIFGYLLFKYNKKNKLF